MAPDERSILPISSSENCLLKRCLASRMAISKHRARTKNFLFSPPILQSNSYNRLDIKTLSWIARECAARRADYPDAVHGTTPPDVFPPVSDGNRHRLRAPDFGDRFSDSRQSEQDSRSLRVLALECGFVSHNFRLMFFQAGTKPLQIDSIPAIFFSLIRKRKRPKNWIALGIAYAPSGAAETEVQRDDHVNSASASALAFAAASASVSSSKASSSSVSAASFLFCSASASFRIDWPSCHAALNA